MGTVRAGQDGVSGSPPLRGPASARTKKVGWMFTNYVPLRRGLEEHAKFGRGFGLTHEQGWAFTLILMRADCETGLWRGSSKALLQYNWTHRQAKKILESLEKKGYIKRFCKPRQRGNYLIAVDKYGVTRGPHRGLVVDAKQSTSPESVVYRVWEEWPLEGQLEAPSQEVRKENEKKKRKNTAQASPSPLVDSFESFWKLYPKKVGKLVAQRAWGKVPRRTSWRSLIDGLQRWKQTEQWQKEGGKFIPYPATFLNQRRWEDDPPDSAHHRTHYDPREPGLPGKCNQCGVEIPAGFLKCLKCMKN